VVGVDFFETYAPVVQWTTICLMLILEVLLGLKSKQGNVTVTFLHALLGPNEHIYCEMPLGFRIPGKVLKLKKLSMAFVNLLVHSGSILLRKWPFVE
jgi:hypothetical protein